MAHKKRFWQTQLRTDSTAEERREAQRRARERGAVDWPDRDAQLNPFAFTPLTPPRPPICEVKSDHPIEWPPILED